MSSEKHVQKHISSGKDEFSVCQLDAALKESQTLVHPDVDKVFAHKSHDAVASAADLEKFYEASNSVDAPVTSIIKAPEQHVATATVIAAIALAIQKIAQTLWNIFRGWDDKAGRSQWTQDLVLDLFNANPQFNYVIVHTSHSTNFNGVRDQDWSSRTYDYQLRIGQVRYTLYAFRSGTFSLHGDGGFLNWAYIGRVVSADPDSRRPRNVIFCQ